MMVAYEFQSFETEEIVCFDYPMGKAPKLGEVVTIDGSLYVRIPSRPRLGGDANYGFDFRLESQRFPDFWGQKEGVHSRFSEDGRPRFTSVREAKNYAKAYSAKTGCVMEFDR